VENCPAGQNDGRLSTGVAPSDRRGLPAHGIGGTVMDNWPIIRNRTTAITFHDLDGSIRQLAFLRVRGLSRRFLCQPVDGRLPATARSDQQCPGLAKVRFRARSSSSRRYAPDGCSISRFGPRTRRSIAGITRCPDARRERLAARPTTIGLGRLFLMSDVAIEIGYTWGGTLALISRRLASILGRKAGEQLITDEHVLPLLANVAGPARSHRTRAAPKNFTRGSQSAFRAVGQNAYVAVGGG
jgi:hypothetical protein